MTEAGSSQSKPQALGNYELLERVGHGAMGAVYRARQISMDRIVALKILPPKLARDEGFVERFMREARSAGQCNHQNLLQVHDVGQAGGYYYYSMEFVEGSDLGERLKKHGPLDEPTALRMMLSVAGALTEAHNKGIVHRDVKPDNILLTAHDDPKLADLGLAKPMSGEADVTMGGRAMGTPHYMSPEQAKGEPCDGRADLYGLGATFFHVLTGETLFSAPTSAGVMIKHSGEAPRPLRQVRPDISSSTEAIILKLLAKNPDDRYADAEQLAEDLVAASHGRPLKHARSRGRKGGTRRTRPVGAVDTRDRNRSAGQPDDAPPNRSPLILGLVGGAVVLLAIGAVVLFSGNGETPRASDSTDAARTQSEASGETRAISEADATAEAETTTAEFANDEAAKMLEYVLSLAAAKPDNREQIVSMFERVQEIGQGTVTALKAETELEKIRTQWQVEAETALEDLRTRIDAQVAAGAYEAALAALDAFPEQHQQLVGEEWAAARSDVVESASTQANAILAQAQEQIEAGQFDAAKETLQAIEQLELAEVRELAEARANGLRAQIDATLQAQREAAERAAREKRNELMRSLIGQWRAGQYVSAHADLTAAAADLPAGAAADEVRAAAAVSQAFVDRSRQVVEGLRRKIGQEDTFLYVNGYRYRGIVKGVNEDQIDFEQVWEMRANGQSMSGSRPLKFKLSQLDDRTREELMAAWSPPREQAAIWPLMTALVDRSANEAQAALPAIAGHPLQTWAERQVRALTIGEAEAAAEEAWLELSDACDVRKPSEDTAKRLLEKCAAFTEQHEATEYYQTVADPLDAIRRRLELASGEALNRGLIAYYPCDEGKGTTLSDALGGSAIKIPGVQWVPGKVRGGVELGKGIHGSGPHNPQLEGHGALTVCAWIKPTKRCTGTIIGQRDHWRDKNNMAFQLSCDMAARRRRSILIGDIADLRNRTQSSDALKPGVWQHVAVVFDGKQPSDKRILLFQNGRQIGSFGESPRRRRNKTMQHTAIPRTTCRLWVGTMPAGGDYTGRIDDIRIYNRPLTAAELASLAGVSTEATEEAAKRPTEAETGNKAFEGRYKVIAHEADWAEAKAWCEQQGGHLATVTSAEEAKYLADLMSKQNIRSAFVGLVKTHNDPKWITGESTEWCPLHLWTWRKAEPGTGGLMTLGRSGNFRQFQANHRGKKHAFIFELR